MPSPKTDAQRTYAVHLETGTVRAVEKLKAAYSFHQLSPTLFLVRTADLASTVSETLGIDGEQSDGEGGIVLKLNDVYAGYYYQDTWDWLGLDE